VDGGWDRDYHPVAGAAVVGAAVAVGAAAATPTCTTVYSEGNTVQTCQ
jgi:di/tricarboxylate transporter